MGALEAIVADHPIHWILSPMSSHSLSSIFIHSSHNPIPSIVIHIHLIRPNTHFHLADVALVLGKTLAMWHFVGSRSTEENGRFADFVCRLDPDTLFLAERFRRFVQQQGLDRESSSEVEEDLVDDLGAVCSEIF